MEKCYEKPGIQIIRYQRRVRTETVDFTDSKGVPSVKICCRDCGEVIAILTAETWDNPTIDDLEPVADAYDKHQASVHGYQ